MARSAADQRAVVEILERDLGVAGLPLTLGTGPKVRRALIPAAGFGTRLFPATKATKKELFPVVDRDGIAKPAILLIVEEALEAGIEEVVIVVQEDDLEDFRSFFNAADLDRELQQAAAALPGLRAAHPGDRPARHVRDPDRPGGLRPRRLLRPRGARRGALPADAGRPPLPLDDATSPARGSWWRPTSARGRASWACAAPRRRRSPRSAPPPGSGSSRSGCSTSPSSRRSPPSTTRARSLRVPGLPDGEYLTVFGQYIIKPQLFDYLEEHIRNNVRERGEFQLTSALDRLRQEDGFHGLIVDGRRFDIGLPEHYLETLRTFRED